MILGLIVCFRAETLLVTQIIRL